MYEVTLTQDFLKSDGILCEIPGERYSIIHEGRAIAVLFPSTEPDIWLMDPIRTEAWVPALSLVTVIRDYSDGVKPSVWGWLKKMLSGG